MFKPTQYELDSIIYWMNYLSAQNNNYYPRISFQNTDLCHLNLNNRRYFDYDFNRSDLTGADLSYADFKYADISEAKGIYVLDMVDPRGYQPFAWKKNGVWIINSGCHSMPADLALEHWGENYNGIRFTGERYIRAIKDFMKTDEYKEGLCTH